MEEQSTFRTTLSWVLYHLGCVVECPMHRWDLSFLYPVYSRLMAWSVNLDKAGKVWLYVEEDEGV